MGEDPSEIREAIDATRNDLADTIEALGHKADVKSRLAEMLQEGKEKAATRAGTAGEQVGAALPDSVKPFASTVIDKTQTAGRKAFARDDRSMLIAAVTFVLIAAVVWPVARRRRNR